MGTLLHAPGVQTPRDCSPRPGESHGFSVPGGHSRAQAEWPEQQNCVLSSSGGQKSKVKVSAGRVPSQGSWGASVPFSQAPSSLLASLGSLG